MILEDAYVSFLIEHDITQNQYLLLHLAHKKRWDLVKKYKDKFPSGDDTMIGEYFINDLIKKDFLKRDADGNLGIGQKFLEVFINKHNASEHIFDIYPTHFMKDGVTIPLSAMDRNMFANLYDIAISSSTLEHLEVVKDIEYAIEHNLLNLGLDKFVKSKYWLTIRPKRLDTSEKQNTKTKLDNNF